MPLELDLANALYNAMTEDPVTMEMELDYDLADQTAGRREYMRRGGWGDPQLPRETAKQRSDYAWRLKRQRELARQLEAQGIAPYLPGGEFATEENTR